MANINAEHVRSLSTEQLTDTALNMTKNMEEMKAGLDVVKAELQKRAEQFTADRNIKFTEFSGKNGFCSVTTAQKLEILNLPKLKELLGETLVSSKVKIEMEEKQKLDARFKDALIAIFLNEYNTEFTVEQIVRQIAVIYNLPDASSRLLQKKLKGDYRKDKQTLMNVIGLTEADFNLDEELYYIYQIKKFELIKAFISEEDLQALKEQIKKCMIVEEAVKVEVKPLMA